MIKNKTKIKRLYSFENMIILMNSLCIFDNNFNNCLTSFLSIFSRFIGMDDVYPKGNDTLHAKM